MKWLNSKCDLNLWIYFGEINAHAETFIGFLIKARLGVFIVVRSFSSRSLALLLFGRILHVQFEIDGLWQNKWRNSYKTYSSSSSSTQAKNKRGDKTKQNNNTKIWNHEHFVLYPPKKKTISTKEQINSGKTFRHADIFEFSRSSRSLFQQLILSLLVHTRFSTEYWSEVKE